VEGDLHRCQPIYIGRGYSVMGAATGECSCIRVGFNTQRCLRIMQNAQQECSKRSRCTSLQPRCKTAPPDLHRDNPIYIGCLMLCYEGPRIQPDLDTPFHAADSPVHGLSQAFFARQKDYPRGHSAKPGGVAIGPPCPAGLSISATNSLDTNETLDARVFLQGFRICRYQGCYMAWCEAL
jgi:hypothetical protein